MCPLCTLIIVALAGAASTGAADTFVARSFARIARPWKTTPPESKESIRHD
jgi:hypothetical protein